MPKMLKALFTRGLTCGISLSRKAHGLIVSMSFIAVMFLCLVIILFITVDNAKLHTMWAIIEHTNSKVS